MQPPVQKVSAGAEPAIGRVALAAWIVGMALLALGGSLVIQSRTEVSPKLLDPDGWGRMGLELADGRGLRDGEGNVSAFRGPVVPVVYAAAALLFGASLQTLLTVQCVFFALAAAVLGLVCQRVFRSLRVTVLAMAVYVGFLPAWGWFCHLFTEPIFTTCLALFILAWIHARERGGGHWLTAGLLLAIAALCRPVMYFFVPLVLLAALLEYGFSRKMVLAGALLVLGFALLEGPWIARNAIVFGKFIPTTSGSSQALFLATWYQEANWMNNVFHDPARFPPARDGFWKLPPEVREARFREMAMSNVREAPGAVALLVPRRALVFMFQMRPRGWLPTPKSILLQGFLYAFAAFGLWKTSAEARARFLPCLCLLGFQLAFHALLTAEYRYSHPVQPYVFMLSAVGMWAVADRSLPRRFASRIVPAAA